MLNWYTPQELAGLPDMPATVSGVIRMAKREGWEGQRRLGSKAIEYHIAVLPEVTRVALLKAATAEVVKAQPEPLPVVAQTKVALRPLSSTGALNHRQTLERDARLLVVNLIKRRVHSGFSQKTAINQLLAEAARGELPASVVTALALGNNKSGLEWAIRLVDGQPSAELLPGQDLQATVCGLRMRTLERWMQLEREGGLEALAPGKREKDMSLKPWVPYLLAQMQRPQKPHLSDAWRAMCKALPEGVTAPSYHAVYRWYSQKFSSLDKQRGRHQGSALNPHKYARTRSSDGMQPMQEIHSDGWGTHFTAPHPVSGKYVKLEVWHTHDVATRYVFRPSVGLSESMLVILGSLYNAVAEGGVPAVWQTDNTGSVKNDRVSFDPVTSIQARAGITIVHNLPGNSQANGICENFNQYLDRKSRELATYMGKRMDSLAAKRVLKVTQKLVKTEVLDERRALKEEAQRLGSGRLLHSFEEAQALIEQWCDEFNRTPHSALPKVSDPSTGKRRHQTPTEAWADHVAQGWQPVAVAGELLHDLFRPHETKVVRRAKVHLYSQSYHHPELEHWNGESVQVAYDIHDGERVWVKTLEGRLICEARLDSVRGYRARSVYEMALEKRADAAIARHEAHIAEVERQRPIHVLEHHRLSVPGLGDLTPERLNQHMGALREDQAELVLEPSPPTDSLQPLIAAVLPEPAPEWCVPEQPDARWALWHELDEHVRAGRDLDPSPLKWHSTYPHTKEFRALSQRLA